MTLSGSIIIIEHENLLFIIYYLLFIIREKDQMTEK